MKSFLLKILTFSVCVSMLTVNTSALSRTADGGEKDEPHYREIGARGVWHRPNSSGRETTLEGLCSVLDEMSCAGINMVFLETFYHGMTVFKTNLVPYYTGFDKFDYGEYPDYLTAFTAEARKRGIEVHAWVECFYLGVNEDATMVKYFPKWLLVNESGKIRHTTEGKELGGYIFLDPANADARAYLLRFFDEMLRRVPDLAGLNLDYIRYPVSDFYSGTDSGYTPSAMTEFAEKYGISVNNSSQIQEFKAQIKAKSLVNEWIDYRAGKVTDFVREVSEMVRVKYRDSIISVAVHPDINSAYNQKKQDFITWVNDGYIDVVTPMVYYYDANQISSALKGMLAKFEGVYCYSGLYTTYHNQSTNELDRHINASNSCGADGFVLFESVKTFFNPSDSYTDYLSEKHSALSALPHLSTERLIVASTDIISAMLVENGEDDAALKAFAEEMNAIALIGERSEASINKTIVELTSLRDNKLKTIVGEDSLSPATDVLDLLIEFLEVRRSRLSFKGYLGEPELPDIENPPSGDNNPPEDSSPDVGGEEITPPNENVAPDKDTTPDEDIAPDEGNSPDGNVTPEPPVGGEADKKGFLYLLIHAFQKIINWFKSLFAIKGA